MLDRIPILRSLMVKLALFYALLSLPTMILVETTILMVEFHHLMQEVDNGALQKAALRAADDMRSGHSPHTLTREPWIAWLESWVIRLQLPREGFSGEASYILSELSREPLAAAYFSANGQLIAQAPPYRERELQLPQASQLQQSLANQEPKMLPGADEPIRLRRVLHAVHNDQGVLMGWLYLELRVPPPWQKVLGDISFEWPIVLAYLLIFALASAFFLTAYVTRRLNRVSAAAAAWSQGDFSYPIGDDSPDELGRLSRSLDRMALQLKELMKTRTQLAMLEERQRLARDLHDTVKQKAFVLNLQLAAAQESIKDKPKRSKLATAQNLCHEIQCELSALLDKLADDYTPLRQRLENKVNSWRELNAINLLLDCNRIPPLDTKTADNLLRICDEALANIFRHSQATEASIQLHHKDNRIMLTITDNGKGNAQQSASGMGIANMRNRALELVQGAFEFDSQPGQGTSIEVSCLLQTGN